MNQSWTLCLDAAFWGMRALGIGEDGGKLWQEASLTGRVAHSFFDQIAAHSEVHGAPARVLMNIGPGSFTGIKLSIAYARGLQCGFGADTLKVFGYKLEDVWLHAKGSNPKACEHVWGLPITAKKMILCSSESLQPSRPKEAQKLGCLVLPGLSPESLELNYQGDGFHRVSMEAWAGILESFWVGAVQSGFSGLSQNPKPYYFFRSSAEEQTGVNVT